MRRRDVLRALSLAPAVAALAATRAASAFDIATPFSKDAFIAAQVAGKPILVDVWASWCPVCARQTPTLSSLASDPAFKDMVVFRVDFDAQKDVVREFGVRAQSTLIVFHGLKEISRSVGETAPDAIRALLATGLA